EGGGGPARGDKEEDGRAAGGEHRGEHGEGRQGGAAGGRGGDGGDGTGRQAAQAPAEHGRDGGAQRAE
ncbi:hypothetical protein C3R44_23085, partial [Mycobacterium tuberculosis]